MLNTVNKTVSLILGGVIKIILHSNYMTVLSVLIILQLINSNCFIKKDMFILH